MKKLLPLCFALLLLSPLFLLIFRHFNNHESVTPYPYLFKANTFKSVDHDATILIVGDKIAKRVATLKKELAYKITGEIEKTIKIQALAVDGEGLHRTLQKIKKLERLPLIIVMLSNYDMGKEQLFHEKEASDIYQNLKIFENPLIKSFLIVFPDFSKYFYNHVDYIYLGEKIISDENLISGEDNIYQAKMRMNFKLYEAMLDDLFSYTTKRNSIIIPITTPINLMQKPIKSCYGSLTPDTQDSFNAAIKHYRNQDYKSAYNITKDLVLINSSHASTLYLHGLITKRLNRPQEAFKYLNASKAFDCGYFGAHPVYNAILKKQTANHGLEYLDFHHYLYDQGLQGPVFIEDIYPQDVYLEKLTDMLAIKIKQLLKL